MTQTAIEIREVDDSERLVRMLVEQFLDIFPSPGTRAGYGRDLGLWLDWLYAHGLEPLNLRKGGAILAFLSERRELGDSDSTYNRRASAIASWYDYLIELEYLEVNPARLTKRQRATVDRSTSHTLALSKDQVDELLALADADSPLASALVAMLIVTGARISEILTANHTDLTMQMGHIILPITGKGRKLRDLPIPPQVYGRYLAYHAGREDQVEVLPALQAGAKAPLPLFTDARGTRLSRFQAHRLLKRLARGAAGSLGALVDRFSAHVTRHTYATALLQADVPQRKVQYALGHQSGDTTQRYDHADLDPDTHPNYVRITQVQPRRPN